MTSLSESGTGSGATSCAITSARWRRAGSAFGRCTTDQNKFWTMDLVTFVGPVQSKLKKCSFLKAPFPISVFSAQISVLINRGLYGRNGRAVWRDHPQTPGGFRSALLELCSIPRLTSLRYVSAYAKSRTHAVRLVASHWMLLKTFLNTENP